MTSLEISMVFNLGSLVLGLAAWTFGYLAIRRSIIRKDIKASYTCSIASFGTCIISLLFQLLEVGNRVNIEDLSAIYDTIDAVIMAAEILITVTFALNVCAWIKVNKNLP